MTSSVASRVCCQDLVSALKDELTGDFEELIVALIYTPAEYDVHCLREAVEGLGTRESALIGIICSRSNRVRRSHNLVTV